METFQSPLSMQDLVSAADVDCSSLGSEVEGGGVRLESK